MEKKNKDTASWNQVKDEIQQTASKLILWVYMV